MKQLFQDHRSVNGQRCDLNPGLSDSHIHALSTTVNRISAMSYKKMTFDHSAAFSHI